MKFLKEDLRTVDDLSQLCKKLDAKHSTFGGNCGNFALALVRELVKKGFDENNLGIVVCSSISEEDLQEYNYNPRVYEDAEADIYHVAIAFGDVLFDGSGETSISELKKIAQEEYRDNNPTIYLHPYSSKDDDNFRFAFEWATNHDVSPEYYQRLIEKEKI